MKVAIAQITCTIGDVTANCSKIRLYAEKAKAKKCEMVVFPEMVDTGYEMATIREKASSWNDVPFKTLQRTAVEFGIYMVCGLSERVDSKIYNTSAVFDPKGELIGKYRKTHLASYPPLNEGDCISPGNMLEIVQINDMKWGLLICYDLRFPEINRSLVLKGAEVLVLCSAWPFPRLTHWKILTRARAIENQVYFIAANRVGTDGNVTFCGSSCIVDPYGVIITSAAEDREELIVGEISRETLIAVRNKMPIFKHRRDDLYNLKNFSATKTRKH